MNAAEGHRAIFRIIGGLAERLNLARRPPASGTITNPTI
jgi:hypothetical protein